MRMVWIEGQSSPYGAGTSGPIAGEINPESTLGIASYRVVPLQVVTPLRPREKHPVLLGLEMLKGRGLLGWLSRLETRL
jgi:hypothetical protein